MTKQEIAALSVPALKSIIAIASPTGVYANEVKWAKEELEHRGVDYSDCLEPQP